MAGTWSDDSSVYRRDPLTGDVVLYAPGRDLRPQSAASKAAAPKTEPPQGVARPPVAGVDPECPFCPGNEHLLPPIGWEVPGPTSGEWLARVVPNKYPIVPGTWRHLVVIETPRHGEGLESLPSTHLETVLRTYRRVFGEVSSGAGVRCSVLFRNQGVAGGASLAHPHTQVVGVDVVPDRVRRREARSHDHHGRTGRCLVCDMMAAEEAVGVRMVTADPGFVAFVPWAAEVPCDTWIVPRRHQADFRDLRDDEVPGLATVFRDVLTRVGAVSSAYNVTLESCSLDPGGQSGTEIGGDPALHWFLRVRPRVTVAAGFEVATGISINPSLPERDAGRLRGAPGGVTPPSWGPLVRPQGLPGVGCSPPDRGSPTAAC